MSTAFVGRVVWESLLPKSGAAPAALKLQVSVTKPINVWRQLCGCTQAVKSTTVDKAPHIFETCLSAGKAWGNLKKERKHTTENHRRFAWYLAKRMGIREIWNKPGLEF